MSTDQFNRSLYLDMSYNLKANTLTIEDTNVKRECIDDLLSEWIRGQTGQGKDDCQLAIKDEYHLNLQVDLSYDYFRIRSDTGNAGLTAGIILASIGKWKFSSELEKRLKNGKRRIFETTRKFS